MRSASGRALRLSIGGAIIPLAGGRRRGATESVLRLTDGEPRWPMRSRARRDRPCCPIVAPARQRADRRRARSIGASRSNCSTACAVRRGEPATRPCRAVPVAGRRIGVDGDVPASRAGSAGYRCVDPLAAGRAAAWRWRWMIDRFARTRTGRALADATGEAAMRHLSLRPVRPLFDLRWRAGGGSMSELFLIAHDRRPRRRDRTRRSNRWSISANGRRCRAPARASVGWPRCAAGW